MTKKDGQRTLHHQPALMSSYMVLRACQDFTILSQLVEAQTEVNC